jgi:exonuclease III
MEWNENRLLGCQHELQVILSTENIDICLISETHFTKESFIGFKNYITYHTIHPANTARGGSAIIIRNNNKHFEEGKYITCDIQATIVTTETSKQRLTVSAIYYPPRFNIYANEYKTLSDKMNSHFTIGGDINAKHTHWSSRLITTKGRDLYKAAADTGCEITSTGKQMYWPHRSKGNSRFNLFLCCQKYFNKPY